MYWPLAVLKRAVFARVPFGATVRQLKRRLWGYEPDPANLRGTLSNLEQMTAAISAKQRSFKGATVLEIGSGWFPTIPIMLALGGASRVIMTDLTPHMDNLTFEAALRFLKSVFPANSRLHAISRLADLPITYLAPFRAGEVADGSIDFIISRTVLEHIPRDDLIRLLEVLRPKLTRNGLMVHCIDNSDHLEHGDKSISKINFLTWSKRKHSLVNSLMRGGENRLRHHQYPDIFAIAGFGVISASTHIHEPTRQIATNLPLARPYSTMSAEQLAALNSTFVLAPMQTVSALES